MTTKNDIEHLFKTHYSSMYRLAISILHDEDISRDIVHDVFVSILRGNISVRVNEGYLLKAVRNRCLNHIRNCSLRQKIANLYFVSEEQYSSDEWPDEETMEQINTLISTDVTPQARRIIELRFNDGLSFSHISKEMGISETAIYRHISKALKLIRLKLNDNG